MMKMPIKNMKLKRNVQTTENNINKINLLQALEINRHKHSGNLLNDQTEVNNSSPQNLFQFF